MYSYGMVKNREKRQEPEKTGTGPWRPAAAILCVCEGPPGSRQRAFAHPVESLAGQIADVTFFNLLQPFAFSCQKRSMQCFARRCKVLNRIRPRRGIREAAMEHFGTQWSTLEMELVNWRRPPLRETGEKPIELARDRSSRENWQRFSRLADAGRLKYYPLFLFATPYDKFISILRSVRQRAYHLLKRSTTNSGGSEWTIRMRFTKCGAVDARFLRRIGCHES
jgi:hypothetical protein